MKWLLCLLPFVAYSDLLDDVRRVHAHLSIDDATSALNEAEMMIKKYPESVDAGMAWIEALAANGFEERAMNAWNALSVSHPELIQNRRLLEEICWGILKKGVQSTQFGVRLSSLVGAYLTRDARALPILLSMMRDSNAVVRSVAIQMSGQFCDAPLKDEIKRLMQEEKIWMVRLAVIQAAGALRMKELVPQLKAIIQSEKSTYEERGLSIEALLNIYEKISLEELKALAHSNRAGMRHLACSIAARFEVVEGKEIVFELIRDSNPQVRIAALNAVGLFYRHFTEKERLESLLSDAMKDADPSVAITASWAALLAQIPSGVENLEKWLNDEFAENRRLAAAAVATAGSYGVKLAGKTIESSQDRYVQVNLAIGLLGQAEETEKCCNLIFDFLLNEKRMWMWDQESNPLFKVLAVSKVRYIDHIPNYPEAVDQMTRLNLVSLLALADDPRAAPALKNFLQKRSWGITGVAAATLLQEGDDSSMEVVKELLNDSDPDVRLQASLVLAMMGRDESVLRDLQGAYGQASHERKLHILEALARISSPDSHSFLVGLLHEPFSILRVAAAAALIQTLNH